MLSRDQPFRSDLDFLFLLAQQTLQNKQLRFPDGEPQLKKKKKQYELLWGDLRYQVKLQGKVNDRYVTLVYKQRSPLAQAMRIHRADAGDAFKTVSLFMSAALLLILLSGVILGIMLPRFRTPLILSITLGSVLIIFLIL